jgi:hypothetical protein
MLQTSKTKKSPDDKGICENCANPCQNQPDGMYGEMMVLDWCEGFEPKQ